MPQQVEVLFGSNPPPLNIPTSGMISQLDPTDYSSCLQRKLLELRELFKATGVILRRWPVDRNRAIIVMRPCHYRLDRKFTR